MRRIRSRAQAFDATTRRRCDRGAFTLVELLIVIAIIGILMAILTPAIHLARERARNLQCQSNLRQFGIGLMAHASGPNGAYCTGAWNWLEDGAVTEKGWVADLVNQEIPVGEMLCPSNPARASMTFDQLMKLESGDFKSCETGLGSEQKTLPNGDTVLNPSRAILEGSEAPDSPERAKTVTERIYEKGYNTNYTPSWFLCRTGLRLGSEFAPAPRDTNCDKHIRARNACVGPLRTISLSNVVSSTVPIVGDGRPSTTQLSATIGRVPQGDFLVYSITGGPRLKDSAKDVIKEDGSGYESGATGGARWTDLAENSVQDYSQFGIHHGGYVNVVMADGSVKGLQDTNDDGALNTGFEPQGPFQDNIVEASQDVEQKLEHLYSLEDKSARSR